MTRFWTSDLHFGHPNIIAYANRPFLKKGDMLEEFTSGKPKWASQEKALEAADRMNKRLILEINMRCKPSDILYHIGDFCCYGNERGIKGVKKKSQEWEADLNPRVIHALGNHDKNNHVKGAAVRAAVVKVSHWLCWVQHVPPWNALAIPAPPECNAYICGHVHEKWQLEKYEGIPVVNVGVDANNLRPVKETELINLIRKAQE